MNKISTNSSDDRYCGGELPRVSVFENDEGWEGLAPLNKVVREGRDF